MSADIYQYLRDGCTVVTANNRLARHLELEFSKAERASGKAAWRTPDVLPWSLWILRVWQEARISIGAAVVIGDQRVLSSNQSALVWEQVINDLLDKHPTANPPALARLASRSWKLLHQWQVASADMCSAAYSADQKAFVAWSNSFRQRCKQQGWLTAEELPARIGELLSKGLIDVSAPIRFVGFDDFNPQESMLLQALVEASVDAELIPSPQLLERCERLSFADEEQELTAAARWAKERLQKSPGESVAVLIPDLEQREAHVRRVFMDCLMPDWRSTGGKFLPPVNISLGQPLVEKGMISTALRLLGLPWRAMPFADISLLLRSPYIAHFDSEQMQRAAAELALREQGIVEIRARSLAYRTRETAPEFSQLLAAMPKWNGSARASVWAERFAGLLKSCGWPGKQSPQSSEYRAFTKWQKLIEELAGMDAVLGEVSVGLALRVLRSMSASMLFQAEGNPDGV
ncbi:MAG: hypothetical protein P8R04_04145, partial [Gammaproteobacteria bacterium]|nr:hypothetical protein [Gammaproteobacteria bacterium]